MGFRLLDSLGSWELQGGHGFAARCPAEIPNTKRRPRRTHESGDRRSKRPECCSSEPPAPTRTETRKAVKDAEHRQEKPEVRPITRSARPQNLKALEGLRRLNGVAKPLAVESQEEAPEALVSCGELPLSCGTDLVCCLYVFADLFLHPY